MRRCTTKAYSAALKSLGDLTACQEQGLNERDLFDKDFRKYQQVSVNGKPTWVNSYFQGGSSVSGVTQAGRTFWVTANMKF